MAAPHVAGAWAILKQQRPSASVAGILSALQSTGTPITDTRPGGTVTKPRINISDALAVLSPLDNDNFMHPQAIRGSTASVNDTNVGATRQPGGPDHLPHSSTSSGEHSVWYNCTAPSSGKATFDTCTSDFVTTPAAYTGNTVNGLSPVTGPNDTSPCGTDGRKIAFKVTPGTSYKIAVAGEGSAEEGSFELGLDMAPEVTATKPADGAVKVSRSANVSSTFSGAMDAGSINTTSFRLVRQGAAAPTSATATSATKTAKLDPGARLKRGALYTATVTTLVEDQAGSPLAQSETWSFKVRRR